MKLTKTKSLLAVSIIAATFLSGCSAKMMLPYEDEFTCPMSNEGGECGSISKIYQHSLQKQAAQELRPNEKRALKEASNTEEEHTALIGALWRMNKELYAKVNDIETKLASIDFKANMATGIASTLSQRVDSLEEKYSKLAEKVDKNATTESETNSTKTQCEAQKIAPTKNTKKAAIRHIKPCKIEGKTNEPCDENSTKCYSTTALKVTKDSCFSSKFIRVDPSCTIYTTIGKMENGRVNIGDGWVAHKYLKKIVDKNTSVTKTPKQDRNTSKIGDKNVSK